MNGEEMGERKKEKVKIFHQQIHWQWQQIGQYYT